MAAPLTMVMADLEWSVRADGVALRVIALGGDHVLRHWRQPGGGALSHERSTLAGR